jgi:hypothetical protein
VGAGDEGAGTYCSSDSSSWIRASAKKATNFRVSLEEQSQGLVPSPGFLK